MTSGTPGAARHAADNGFDRCSTSSNDSFDTGAAGVASTLAALDAAGLTTWALPVAELRACAARTAAAVGTVH